ncbi:MAG: NADH-quinone oxidoreductase subunit J [Actinobacteria bacterium]|nr:NADH-quinone oxidoreductase subunit J [Actinomycetota bacterium]
MTSLDLAFLATGGLALVAGLLAITSTRVVHAALWLVAALLGVSGSLLVLGAELVSLVLVLVYVGAIVVLVLFALMVTRAPIGPDTAHAIGWPRRLLAGLAGACVAALLASVLVPLAGGWPGRLVQVRATDSTAVAHDLFATWVWPLEGVSVLLLVALVAALAVSRERS